MTPLQLFFTELQNLSSYLGPINDTVQTALRTLNKCLFTL